MRGRSAVLAALSCVVLAGFATYRYRDTHGGPFELWTFHAGVPFAAMDDAEYESTKRRFVCAQVGHGGRFCQLHGQRIKGMLRVFVDANDRAAVIQFWPGEDNSAFTDNSRTLAAEWTLIAAPVSARAAERSTATTSLWRTTDRHWSATIQYGCYGSTPTVIEIADAAAVADFITRNPDAVEQLVHARVIPPSEEAETSVAPRRAPGQCDEPEFLRPTP